MQKNLLMAICVFPAFTSVKAQDSARASSFKLSGSADIYYRYDFNNPKVAPYNNFTSFTHSQNSFEPGMVSVKAEHTMKKGGVVADIGFGKRAQEFSYNDSGSSVAIKQLYVTCAPVSGVKLTLGSWATHIGYEAADAFLNRNYSMSYLFSYGPFFHTGLKSEFALGEKSSLMIGIASPFDLKYASGLPKMMIAQLATTSKDEKLKASFNYQGGKYNDSARLYQEDIVINYFISDKFGLGYNGTLQTRQEHNSIKWNTAGSWWGAALYVNADPKSWLGFTLRGEYFNDKKKVLGFDATIFETTFSANFKIDALVLIPEFRYENASENIYKKSNGAFVKNTSSFLLAAVYKF
ncbi:MAG: outer membrane beta-barrel protein [Ginsengibacter sp.]